MDRVEIVASQQHGVSERTGVSATEAVEAAWAVNASGIKVGGARAAALALAVGRDARWPLISWQTPVRFVGLPWILDRVYELVASYRYRIPGDEPWCRKHSDQCEPPAE